MANCLATHKEGTEMSVIIKGMKMPERCGKCPMCLHIPQKNGLVLCLLTETYKDIEYNPEKDKQWRAPWCPLMEVEE